MSGEIERPLLRRVGPLIGVAHFVVLSMSMMIPRLMMTSRMLCSMARCCHFYQSLFQALFQFSLHLVNKMERPQ